MRKNLKLPPIPPRNKASDQTASVENTLGLQSTQWKIFSSPMLKNFYKQIHVSM